MYISTYNAGPYLRYLERAYDKGRRLLKDLGFLVLIGNPGSGKTTLGLRLMSYFKNEKKRQPLYLTNYSNFEDIPLSGRFVVMVDDIYGKSNLVTELQNMWQSKFETMYSNVQSGKMKFIITFKTKLFNECAKSLKEFPLFSETWPIDLHGSDYCLIEEEKRKMLNKYLEQIEDKDNEMCCLTYDDKSTVISQTFTELGFPQCCKYFVSSAEAQKRGVAFFKKPIEFLQTQLDSLRTTNRYQYLVLLLVMFGQGTLNADCLNPFKSDESVITLIKQLKDVCGINTDVSVGQIKESANSLCGLYLLYSDVYKVYCFIHQSVFDTLFLQFSSEFLEKGIEICPVRMLLEYVITPDVPVKGDIVVIVQRNNYRFLAERFTKLLKSDSAKEILCHQSFQDELFVMYLVKDFWNSVVPMDILTRKFNYGIIINTLYAGEFAFSNVKWTRGQIHESIILWAFQTSVPSRAVMQNLKLLLDYFTPSLQRIDISKEQQQELLLNSCLMGNRKMAEMLLNYGTVPTLTTLTAAAASPTDDDELFEKLLTFLHVKNVDDLGPKLLISIEKRNFKISSLLINKMSEWPDCYLFFEQAVEMLLNKCYSQFCKFHSNSQTEAEILFEKLHMYLNTNDYDIAVQLAAYHCSAGILKKIVHMKSECLKGSIKPLHIALEQGCVDSVAFLIDHYTNIDMQEALKKALHNSSGVVSYLLERGADANFLDAQNNSPLHFAVKLDTFHNVKTLLENGANVNVKNNMGNTLLHDLPYRRADGAVKLLRYLKEYGLDCDVNTSNERGMTPLHIAVGCYSIVAVNELVSNGASVDVEDADGNTPLHKAAHEAAHYHSSKLLSCLVQNGSKVNAKNKLGRTPLMECCTPGYSIFRFMHELPESCDSLKVLLKHGANLNDTDDCLNTALHYAVNYLIKKGAKVNATNNNGRTPLHLAVIPVMFVYKNDLSGSNKDCLKFVQLLHEKEADLNATDIFGNTALHIAAESNSLQCVQYLTEQGLDVNLQNKTGKTGLHLAAECDYSDVISYLLQKRADPNLRDSDGNTPLTIAETFGAVESMRTLTIYSIKLQKMNLMTFHLTSQKVNQLHVEPV
ncbi:uncharacterized protein LOC121387578 [Gigantopelta aegis]|uniref:uncharacterized protein LOC121387578 n=1 Tax=Gigantopelta aegis TaxID=1735272 RepID=UPI001B8897B3|nr:uncharacterized protein LOC121387578 [Gigantopelta aegis]